MRTLLRCRMRLHAIGECAKRLLAHYPTVLSKLKPRISQEIIIQNEKKFRFFLSRIYEMDYDKKPSHATVPLRAQNYNYKALCMYLLMEVGGCEGMSGWSIV